jgi:hypothetical protein
MLLFRKNDQHLQWPLISDLDALPLKLKDRLESSWAGTFYREVFVRLDEEPFAVLYSTEASRPNIPINVLVGLETLKAGFGWSDEEMYENFCFNLQVRYALGCRKLDEGHFELRTVYNFRRRLSEHMQETGQELLAQAFEQVTDEQVAAFSVQTNKLRMDSTQVASNIRQFSRLQLLVEVLQRVHRDLTEADQQQYDGDFEPYLKGSSGQYVYQIKPGAYTSHLAQIGQVMSRLITELAPAYGQQPSYQMLVRVFNEHFIIAARETEDDDNDQFRPRQGDELSADSLQSPDDWIATYRQKRDETFTGYVANLAETCHPDNPFQLILDLQTEPNTTDDAQMLAEGLTALKKRTDLDEMHTDGGYSSPEVDRVMRQEQVEQIQTAIRGRQPDPTKLNLDDYQWELDPDGQPLALTAPNGQRTEVEPGRKPDRYIARFNQAPDSSPPTTSDSASAKPPPPPVLYFTRQEVELALRRQRSAQAKTVGCNLRAAVEATVGALKRPFSNDKLPVRGRFRVNSMLIGSALMVNLRRIHRYQTAKDQQKETQQGQGDSQNPIFSLPFVRQFRLLAYHLSFGSRFSPVYH